MSLQTAPSTVSVAVTGGNTVFSLVSLRDGLATYRAATVGGNAISDVKLQPRIAFAFREPTAKNTAAKYTATLTASNYDALNKESARHVEMFESTLPAVYTPVDGGMETIELQKAFIGFLNDATIQAAMQDGSFFR